MATLNVPPGLGAATLLFWGWQSELLFFALPLALLFESVHWVRWRWDLSDRELTHIVNLHFLLGLGVGLYLFLEKGPHGLFTLIQWLPLVSFPLVSLVRYSQVGTIAYRSLFLSLRRSQRPLAFQRIDPSFPYLLLCWIGAAMQPSEGFYAGLLGLVAWSLWTVRPRRYAPWRWGIALALSLSGAWGLQRGIYETQVLLEQWILDQVADWYNLRNPSEQSTRIGQIGEIKLSDRILLRVRAPRELGDGLLLRQTSYDHYFEGRWLTSGNRFRQMTALPDTLNWPLASGEPRGPSVEVAMRLRRGRGLLPLPGRTQRIDGLQAAVVERSDWGVVRVREGAEYLIYRARLGEGTPRDGLPTAEDLHLPVQEAALMQKLVAEQGLAQGSPEARVQAVRRFFQQGFSYSLVLNPDRWPARTALAWFLTESRRGHCEYYATATTLLLRAAGIPARYATGFLVDEYSPWEEAYLVRRSHAHSWALAYLDGSWVDVDTTPAVWIQEELQQRSFWQPVWDGFSWLLDRWQRWRWGTEGETANHRWLAWLLIPLFGSLIWRLSRRKRLAPPRRTEVRTVALDSPFYEVLAELQAAGYERMPGEALGHWLRRVRPPDLDQLERLLILHQRLRFDPNGLDPADRAELKRQVGRWLRLWSGARASRQGR